MDENKSLEGIEELFDEPISLQERAFITEYVVDYNLARAAKAAGIKPITAKRCLRKPFAIEQVCKFQNRQLEYNLIKEDYIRTKGLELFRMLMGEEEFIRYLDNKTGLPVMGRKFYAEASVKMWSEMAKSTKLFEEGSSPGDNALGSLAEIFKQYGSDN